MVVGPNQNNDSLDVPIKNDCIRDAAADHPVTTKQVRNVLRELQTALESKLNSLYEDAWIWGGAQTHLYDTEDGVFFAMTSHHLMQLLDDVDKDAFRAACVAHEYQAQLLGFTVDRPTSYADNLKSDYQPVFVRYPDHWLDALHHARQRMMYLLHHDLTPAEALDFWALEHGMGCLSGDQARRRWHVARDVDREAVRKTRRQAKEKLRDVDRQPYYKEQDIETIEVDTR